MNNSTENRESHFVRAFRPFWISLVLGGIVLAFNYHHLHAPYTRLQTLVTIDGEAPDQQVDVTVDQRPMDLNGPIPIGSRIIQVRGPDTETVTLKHFVWYGPNDLGPIDLKRLHGGLRLSIEPKPDLFEVHGKRANRTNSTGIFTDLPAGEYSAVFRFDDLEERANIRVIGNVQTPVARIAQVGSLELSSEPADGKFQLRFPASGRVWEGSFPTNFHRLRAGVYHLTARNNSQQRKYDLAIGPNETNRLVVEYLRGDVEILTDPPGADVWLLTKRQGSTPLKVPALVPGRYAFQIEKPGYESQLLHLNVEESVTLQTNVSLVSIRFRESINSARKNQIAGNFTAAMQDLDSALTERPSDVDILRLKAQMRPRWLREQALVSQKARDYDQALRLLGEALQIEPAQAGLAQLEEEVQRMKANRDALADPATGSRRQKEGAQLFRDSLKDEYVTDYHTTFIWNTGQSLRDALTRCGNMGRFFKNWNVSRLVSNPGMSFTCEFVTHDTTASNRTQAHVGVMAMEDGTAEMRFMYFGVKVTPQGRIPDLFPALQKMGWEEFRTYFKGSVGEEGK